MPELHFARYRNQSKFTHYLFRFPAKFHPPAVRCLIDRYSKPGGTILDPFCGSGTLLVEALLAQRTAVGIDVDPIAAFISRVKSAPLSPDALEHHFECLRKRLRSLSRAPREYDRLMHEDLDVSSIKRFRRRYQIPHIPNIEHWFRTYVVLDLARLRLAIRRAPFAPKVRSFFLACFASIIRNASNADPVPVSGLEVTAHMKRLDEEGRRIDPFGLFERKVELEIRGMRELWLKTHQRMAGRLYVRCADATQLRHHLPKRRIDVVITSPPYNTAVDYYRRHTLEMYWLSFVQSQDDRLRLAPRYLGRVQVRQSNPKLRVRFDSQYVRCLISHARRISPGRERSITHYCASMSRVLEQIARALKPGGRAVFVVGNSKWNGRRVRATRLLTELALPYFEVASVFSYTTRNRYMSYERHNGANVNREFVLVLKKLPKRPSPSRFMGHRNGHLLGLTAGGQPRSG